MENCNTLGSPGKKKKEAGNPNKRRGQIKASIIEELHASVELASGCMKLSVAELFKTTCYSMKTGTGNPYPRRDQIKRLIMKDFFKAFGVIFGFVYL